MKKKKLLLVIFLFTLTIGFAQDVPYQLYQQDLEATDTVNALFNEKMLNLFFANEVGTAFGGSNDLSLQKFYASLDAGDKSLSIGFNYDSRPDDKLKRLKYMHSGSFKLKSSNNFSTVFDFNKDDTFQKDNIGFTYKFSVIGRGFISFNNTDKAIILANRAKLYKEYNQVSNNARELYLEMVQKEIKYINSKDSYRYHWNHWYSFEIYLPFGERTYMTTPNITEKLTERRFWDASLSASANTMWEFSKGYSIFIKGLFNIKNNNNILVDNLSAKAFQTIDIGADNIQIITNSEDGYITSYHSFVTPSLLLEPSFFIKTRIGNVGFSPSVEVNFGDYNGVNWKVGFPLSLNDSEGKPKINFEIQWKKVETFNSTVEVIGLSTNFLFGDLIN